MTETQDSKELDADQNIGANQLVTKDNELATCTNCYQPLTGPFCSACGQDSETTLKYFWSVVLHLLDDIFSFDSRVIRTLVPLLVKPAYITKEYFAGRRVRYVPPLRLYLFISIVFFLSITFFINNNIVDTNFVPALSNAEITKKLANQINSLELTQHGSPSEKTDELIQSLKQSLTDIEQLDNPTLSKTASALAFLELKKLTQPDALNDNEQNQYEKLSENLISLKGQQKIKQEGINLNVINTEEGELEFGFLSPETNKTINKKVGELTKKAEENIRADISKFIQQALGNMPQLMFVLLPIFALLLKFMYMFSSRLYMEHLTVALHSHSFIFLAILIAQLLEKIAEVTLFSLPTLSGLVETLGSLLLVWVPVYLFIMQKRIYQQGFLMTSIKFIVTASIYLMMMICTGFIAVVLGVANS